jgi:hypothetical protein
MELVCFLGTLGSTTAVALGEAAGGVLGEGWLERIVAGRCGGGVSSRREVAAGGMSSEADFFKGGGGRGFAGAAASTGLAGAEASVEDVAFASPTLAAGCSGVEGLSSFVSEKLSAGFAGGTRKEVIGAGIGGRFAGVTGTTLDSSRGAGADVAAGVTDGLSSAEAAAAMGADLAFGGGKPRFDKTPVRLFGGAWGAGELCTGEAEGAGSMGDDLAFGGGKGGAGREPVLLFGGGKGGAASRPVFEVEGGSGGAALSGAAVKA